MRALSYGIDVGTACAVEGISRPVYYHWRKRGETGEEPYASFLIATEQAMARTETRVTGSVVKAAVDGNWQAGMAWLRFRKTGGKTQVELSGPEGKPIGYLSAEAAEEIRRKVLYGEVGGEDPDTGEPEEREP